MLFRSILFTNMIQRKPGGIAQEMGDCFAVIEFTYAESHLRFLGRIAEYIPHMEMWFVLTVSFMIVLFGRNCYERAFRPTLVKGIGCIVLLVWAIMSLSGLSTFLYFNF